MPIVAAGNVHRVRVAMVCGSYEPSRDGVSDYTRRLCAELAGPDLDERVDVHLVTAPRWDWRDLPALQRRLSRLSPDLLHVQFAPAAYGFAPAVGLLGVGHRRVVTLHEYGWWRWPSWLPDRAVTPWERRRWADRETGRLVPGSRTVLVTNEAHRRAVAERFEGLRPVLAPLPANVTPCYPGDRAAARRELGLSDADQLAVYFGFVHPVKGLRYAIEALARLRARHPRLAFLVAGGSDSRSLPGPEAAAVEADLRALASRLGVAPAVRFTGFRPEAEISRALLAADVVVLPFTHGASTKSGSLLAAFAHGAPVVTTQGGGDPALQDGRTALLAQPRDPVSLAAALSRVLVEPGLGARLGAAGQRLVAGRTWRALAAGHLEVYRRALS